MKLENLEKALEEHLAAVKNARRTPGGASASLEEARYAAYREMTLEAWQTYRQFRRDQTETDFIDEVMQSGLSGAVKAELIGREGHKSAE